MLPFMYTPASRHNPTNSTGLAHVQDEARLTESEVKNAFRKQALKWHPDRSVLG